MSLFFTRAEPRTSPEPAPAGEVLDAMAITTTLPEQLIRDATGQSFEPVQISQSGDLMTHLTFLLRREPLGGAEPQIRENARELQEQVLPVLNRALAGFSSATQALLHDLLREARARKEQIDAAFQPIDERFSNTQTRLRRWQERAGQRSGSLGGDLWRWLVGGPDRLSLPEVVALWNEREHLALRRAAHLAALECCTFVLDALTRLLNNLDALIEQARQARTTFQQEQQALRQPPDSYVPWTLRINSGVVAGALRARSDDEALITELLRRLTKDDAAAIDTSIREVARQEASRLVQRSMIADLIALEAGMLGDTGDDPLLLVGQGLLDALNHPTWQLVRSARPRVETIQITPDGTPVYSLEGLSTAEYGGASERLGFVQMQMGIALDELLFLRDADEGFAAALGQRNFYVLEDLALAAEPSAEPANAPPVAPAPATAGQYEAVTVNGLEL